MDLDLRKFVAPVAAQIAQRVSEFDASNNDGPGESGEPIQQITLGFQFDQAAWVALVFDTRPDADPSYDGQWQAHIEENVLECDVEPWMEAYEALFNDEAQPVAVTAVDGTTSTIGPHAESEEDDESEERLTARLAEVFGSVLRDSLLSARDDGVFANLPVAPDCVLRVDDHEGSYGWPDFENRGTESDDGRLVRQ